MPLRTCMTFVCWCIQCLVCWYIQCLVCWCIQCPVLPDLYHLHMLVYTVPSAPGPVSLTYVGVYGALYLYNLCMLVYTVLPVCLVYTVPPYVGVYSAPVPVWLTYVGINGSPICIWLTHVGVCGAPSCITYVCWCKRCPLPVWLTYFGVYISPRLPVWRTYVCVCSTMISYLCFGVGKITCRDIVWYVLFLTIDSLRYYTTLSAVTSIIYLFSTFICKLSNLADSRFK